MSLQRTFSIIKPDAVAKDVFAEILWRFQRAGLRVIGLKMMRMDRHQAETFYEMHRERPFFSDLVEYMTSGPIIAVVLEGEEAIKRYRDLMGATNPKEALPGTIRSDYAESIDANAVHGSDSAESARREIGLMFPELA